MSFPELEKLTLPADQRNVAVLRELASNSGLSASGDIGDVLAFLYVTARTEVPVNDAMMSVLDSWLQVLGSVGDKDEPAEPQAVPGLPVEFAVALDFEPAGETTTSLGRIPAGEAALVQRGLAISLVIVPMSPLAIAEAERLEREDPQAMRLVGHEMEELGRALSQELDDCSPFPDEQELADRDGGDR